jgi:hypothetical protein
MWLRAALAVGIAVTFAACRGGEEQARRADSAMGGIAREGAARVESGARAAAGAAGRAMDTLGRTAERALDTLGRRIDTAAGALKSRAGAAAERAEGAASSAALRAKLTTLSSDQVKQVQTALTRDGCSAGAVDGIVGPKTVGAVQCGMRKHDIGDSDVEALYRALGLEFGS